MFMIFKESGMQNRILLFMMLGLFLAGCSSDAPIGEMGPGERYEYAKKLFDDEDYQDAIRQFEAILLQYPASDVADDAQYYLGMTRFERSEYLLAAYEFSRLINNMSTSSYVPEAQYTLACCYYELAPPVALDQRYTRKAIDEFQAFINFFPKDPRVPDSEVKIKEMNYRLAQKEYNSAVIYEKMDYTKAALQYYQNVVDYYHDTEFAPRALYQKIQLLVSKDRNKEALRDIDIYLTRYASAPESQAITALKEQLVQKQASSQ